jgi:acetyl-CoA acetyltransferase
MTVREREQKMLDMLVTPAVLSVLKAVTVVEYGSENFIRVLGVVGMRILWQGVADVFLIPCHDLNRRNTIGFVRQVKNAIQIGRDEYRIRRYQTAAPDDELHNRWLSFMGFEEEGLMKEYNIDGEDYRLWALRQHY